MTEVAPTRTDRRTFLRGLGYVGLGCVGAAMLGGVTRQVFAATEIETSNSISPLDTIAPAYTVFIDAADGNFVKAQNNNGVIDYSGLDAAQVIQSAINALTNGGKIMLQAGTYTISGGLVSKGTSGIELYGQGGSTVLRLADNTNNEVIYLESVNNWNIHDLQIDGNKANQAANAQYAHGIYGYLCTNLVLENNLVHDCRTTGLVVGAGTGCQVLNNRVLNSGANGITIGNADGGGNTLVQGSTINGASDVGISTCEGIDVIISSNTVTNVTANESPFGGNDHVGIMQEYSSQKITVSNNIVTGCDEGLSNAPVPGYFNTDVTWQANQISNCGKGMYVNNSAGTVISANQISNTTVKGIYVDSQASNVQITGNSLQDIGCNSAIEAAANSLLITGNTIKNVAGDCIVAWGFGDWIVAGNNIQSTSNGGCGILLGSGSNNWTVTKNTINGCAGDGIRIGGASSYNTVNGNQVSLCATGVNINSSLGKNNVVSSNIFEGNKNPLIDDGTGTVKSNNAITTILVQKRS